MRKYYLQQTIKEIKSYAFDTVDSLETVILPVGFTKLESKAFNKCNNLINFYYLSTNSIETGDAISECSKLNEIKVNVYYQGNKELLINNKVVSLVLTPDEFGETENLLRYIYDNTTSLNELIIYGEGEKQMKEFETVEQQPWYKFNKEIKKIYIEDGVKTIGKNSFTSHSMLSSIRVPNDITSIGENAFEYCRKLTIYCQAESKPSGWSSSWNPSNRPVVWGYTGK